MAEHLPIECPKCGAEQRYPENPRTLNAGLANELVPPHQMHKCVACEHVWKRA